MQHRCGEDPKVPRLRESRVETTAAYPRQQDKVILVCNETVERQRGVESRVTTALSQLSQEVPEDIFKSRQQLHAALRESESCVG